MRKICLLRNSISTSIIKVLLSSTFWLMGYYSFGQCTCPSVGNSLVTTITTPTTGSWQNVGQYHAGNYMKMGVCPNNSYYFTDCPALSGISLGQSSNFDGRIVIYDQNWNYLACNANSLNSSCPYAPYASWTAPSSISFQSIYVVMYNDWYASCQTSANSNEYGYMGYYVSGSSSCSCSNWYTSPPSNSVSSQGGSGSFNVYATGSGCNFYYQTNPCPWVTVTAGGAGVMNYSVTTTNCSSQQSCTINLTDASSQTLTSFILTQLGGSTPSAPSASASSMTICNGSSSTITASGACSGCNYTWSNGGSGSQITVTSAGNYTVSVYDPNCGLSSTGYTVAITQGSAPTNPQITPANPKICGSTAASVSVSVSNCNSCTYSWSGGSSPNSSSNSFSSIGTYTVTITNGCGSVNTSTTIANTPAPATPNLQATSSTIGCGGSTQINITNTSAYSSCSGCSYIWSTPSGSVTNSSPNAYTASATGSYSLVVKDNCNQQSGTSNAINITSSVSVPGLPTYTPQNPNTCGTPITITVTPAYQSSCSGCTYQWTTSGGTQTGSSITVSSAQTVTLKATNCNNQSSQIATIQITSTASANISPSTPSACVGDSILITASQGSGYAWNTGATTPSIYGKAGQTYNVVVTAPGGCSGSANANITIGTNPLPIVSVGNDTTVGYGQVVKLNASVSGGTAPYTSYQWNGGANQSAQNTTAIATSPQDYCVTVTDSKGCQASDCFHVDTSSCGGSLTLNKPSSQFGFQGGLDTVFVIAQSGCIWSATSTHPAMTNILSPNGSGNGSMRYVISQCSNSQDRFDTITIGTDYFYITQHCACNLPDTPVYTRNPVTGYITVTNYSNVTFTWQYYGQTLSGDTTRFFKPTATGTYTLIITSKTDPNCFRSIDIEIITGITSVAWIQALDIYPNPAKTYVEVEGKADGINHLTISLVNTIGQKIFQKNVTVVAEKFKSTLNVEDLPGGVYIIQLQTEKGSMTRRLVIEK